VKVMSAVLLELAVVAGLFIGNDVFVSGEEGYRCYRIPATLRLPNGMLAVYVEGRKFSCSDHDWNDIVFKTSSDNGTSWSPLQLMYGNSTSSKHVTIGNPSPVVLHSGEVLMVFCRNNRAVLTMRSPDGVTWAGEPVDVTSQALGSNWTAGLQWIATGPPQGYVTPAAALAHGEPERVLIQANYHGDSVKDLGLALISDDGGHTWRASAGHVPACNEGQIAPAPNGSLLMNCRTGGWHRLLSYSHDRGESWSTPTAYYGFGPAGSNSPCEGSTLRANARALLFSHNFGQSTAATQSWSTSAAAPPNASAPNGCERCNMSIWQSLDSGKTWDSFLQVDADPSTGAAYSSLLVFNDTHTLLVYERGGFETVTLRLIALPSKA